MDYVLGNGDLQTAPDRRIGFWKKWSYVLNMSWQPRRAAAGSHVGLFDRDICHQLMRGLVDLRYLRCKCIRIVLLYMKSTWPGHMHASLCAFTYNLTHVCSFTIQVYMYIQVFLCVLCVCVVSVMSY